MKQFMTRQRLLFLLILLALLVTSFSAAQAQGGATYYVATNGNDSNPGTEASPFRTLNHAVRALRPGDTLLVMQGMYNEELKNNIPSGDSWERPVTLRAYPGHQVTIMPNAGAQRVISFNNNQHHIVIDGFVLDGTNVRYEVIKLLGTTEEGRPSPHHIRIINNEIRNAGAAQSSNGQYKYYSAGILTTGRADYVEYINNHIHHNGVTDYDHGIYHTSSYGLIEGNVIYNNMGSGVKVGWGQNAVNNIVRNNVIYDNNAAQGFDGQKKQGRGIGVYAGSGTQVYNNVIWGGHKAGIDVSYNGNNAQIFNNTISNSMGWGIAVGLGPDHSDRVSNAVIRNNVVYQEVNQPAILDARGINTLIERNLTYGSNATIQRDPRSSATIRDNMVNVNPMFVNAGARDFSLQANSPAVDAGLAVPEVGFDLAGQARPQGRSHDLGAYEVIGSGSAEPPPPPPPPTTPTPAPPPTGPAVQVSVTASSTEPGSMIDVAFNLMNLTSVYGLQVQCSSTPGMLSAVEFRRTGEDVFNDGNSVFVDQGYDAGSGRWLVAASRLQPAEAFSGSGRAFSLRYRLDSIPSNPAFSCEVVAVDHDGRGLAAEVVNPDGSTLVIAPVTDDEVIVDDVIVDEDPGPDGVPVEETPEVIVDIFSGINGVVKYQSRSEHTGISVQLVASDAVIAEASTDAEGLYQFGEVPPGTYQVLVTAPQHLPALREALLETPEQMLELSEVMLVAGDVDNSQAIDILDAGLIGANFDMEGSLFPDADLNSDGIINIMDLVLVGRNFGLTGPQ